MQTITLAVLAVWVLLLAGPILDWRQAAPWRERAVAAAIIAGLLVGARLVLEIAPAGRWSTWALVTGEAYASSLAGPFLSSPLDFLLSAFLLGSLVAVLFVAVHGGRRPAATAPRGGRRSERSLRYAAAQVLAGAGAAVVLLAHTALLRDTVAAVHARSPALLAAAVEQRHARAAGRAGRGARGRGGHHRAAPARRPPARGGLRRRWYGHAFTIACWVLPLVAWNGATGVDAGEQMPQLAALAAAIAVALFARPLRARYRHGSQAFRMILLALGLVVPAVAFYPTMFHLAWQAKSRLIETRYAPVALSQRATVQAQLQESLAQIDQIPGLGRSGRGRAGANLRRARPIAPSRSGRPPRSPAIR